MSLSSKPCATEGMKVGQATILEPFNLIVNAYACSEFGEGPAYAKILVDRAFLDLLIRLRLLCKDNDLEFVSVWNAPEQWDKQDDLRIRGDSLRVFHGDSFWFKARPKHLDYNVETSSINIDDLLKIVQAGQGGRVPHDCFLWSGGTLYYDDDPGQIADLIEMVEPA